MVEFFQSKGNKKHTTPARSLGKGIGMFSHDI